MQGREGLWDAGPVRVQALDWNSPSDVQAAGGPFHYVLAADCVYNEMHVEPLYNVVLALTDAKSTGLPNLLSQKSSDLSDSMYLSCAQPQSLHNWTDQCWPRANKMQATANILPCKFTETVFRCCCLVTALCCAL